MYETASKRVYKSKRCVLFMTFRPSQRALLMARRNWVTTNLFSSFIVSSNRNRSALVRELLCNNSLFVGQLYDDKSLALRVRDLIFFTTDLKTVNYYTTIHF